MAPPEFDVPEPEQTGIGLRQYLDVLLRRKWIVVSVFGIAVVTAIFLSAIERSTYRAESKIVVGQGGGIFQTQFGNQIQPFTATMADLLESNLVAERVIKRLGLSISPEQVLAKTHTSFKPDTATLKVTVDDHSRALARAINEQLGRVFTELVKLRFGQVARQPGEATTPPLTVTVFDPAHVLPVRVSPRPLRNVVIAGALGLILGLLAAFLRDHFDRGLRTREEVERAFGVPVIGQIPFARLGRKRDRRVVFWQGFGEIAEAFRALRANLQYLGIKRPVRTILVTSASPQQGKTTVAANLAVAIARSGATTIVIEGDLRRPRLDDAFELGLHGGPGLTSVLVGAVDIDEAIVDISLPASQDGSARDRDARLSFLPSGPLPPNPSELLSSLPMTKLLDRLSLAYDYVLIDSPPVLIVADALELARVVDGVIVVVRRNEATTDEARELRSTVERLGLNLLGVVFTDVMPVGAYGAYGSYSDRSPEERATVFDEEYESVAHEEF